MRPPFVLVERKTAGQPDLLVGAHPQPVEVQGRFVLDDHRRGALQVLEVSHGLRVDLIAVRIRRDRQIDFRACHAQEAERRSGCQGARFVGVDDVVGNGRDARSGVGRGAQGAEREKKRHPVVLSRARRRN